MQHRIATAAAHPNIAFVKYWGNRDDKLRLPANPSLSMNLAGLETRTAVEFIEGWDQDEVIIGGERQTGPAKERGSIPLNHIRARAGLPTRARVTSRNSFPPGAGIASSASAFAALTLAGAAAAGLTLSERELSALARLGSGSAARSIPSGFVEWQAGETAEDSFAFTIAPPDHWGLVDVIALISHKQKAVGSTGVRALARASPLQAARVASAPDRLRRCRAAHGVRGLITPPISC